MKEILQYSLVLTVMFTCCYSKDHFVGGTYIRYATHEFGTEHDTLRISLQVKDAAMYIIERRWCYQRILDGREMEPEYKIKRTTAFFDAKKNVLREEETGAAYTVSGDLIYNGTIKYRKQ
jgi:hypothetical protein